MSLKAIDINLIVKRIASGDNDAFRMFYDHYYLKVYRFTSYFLTSSQLIEEVVSDVFCIIWKNRKRLETVNNIDGYLYILTKNKAIEFLKEEKRGYSLDELDQLPDQLHDEDDPEAIVIEKEINSSLAKAINELPARCRTIFLMAREEKLKYKEIAEILSISEKTINNQMVIAISKLYDKLKNQTMLFF